VVVRQPGGEDRRIARSEIRETSYLRRSLMPKGLLEAMEPEQARDLLTYLNRCAEAPRHVIRLAKVTKQFGAGAPALEAIDLEIAARKSTVLIGPSGCGNRRCSA
jgi:ATPase subunit of ABC transporter with duplicated ATPase domains